LGTILITGGAGFVGSNLARFFATHMSVIVADVGPPAQTSTSVKWVKLDVTDVEATLSTIEQISPHVVIHTAGNKNVLYCEAHSDEAHKVNALGTQNVARACKTVGAHMIYISTDLVFACTDGVYKETDTPHPTSVYGTTKLQGEELALQELNEVAICRSGGIYGRGSPLLRWLAGELQAGRSVECFTDVYNTPTYAENLAEMIQAIIQQRLSGIFHTVGRERVNRFQFFQTYAAQFGLDVSLLHPVQAGGQRATLILQADASLSQEYTIARIGIMPNSVVEGLARLKTAMGA
jgi:dTDP-4-dehydrorhamnose reductase